MSNVNGWKRLTRDDLKGFDPTATECILEAIAGGCLGRISTKGHCILRPPHKGRTISISRSIGSNSFAFRKVKRDIASIIPKQQSDSQTEIMETTRGTYVTSPPSPDEPSIPVRTDSGTIHIPLPTELSPVTTEERKPIDPMSLPPRPKPRPEPKPKPSNVTVRYVPPTCPKCKKTFLTERGKKIHMAKVHEIYSDNPSTVSSLTRYYRKKEEEEEMAQTPNPTPATPTDNTSLVNQILGVVAPDLLVRVHELEAERDALKQENEELRTKIDLAREALD